jgi:hypothetical protein
LISIVYFWHEYGARQSLPDIQGSSEMSISRPKVDAQFFITTDNYFSHRAKTEVIFDIVADFLGGCLRNAGEEACFATGYLLEQYLTSLIRVQFGLPWKVLRWMLISLRTRIGRGRVGVYLREMPAEKECSLNIGGLRAACGFSLAGYRL